MRTSRIMAVLLIMCFMFAGASTVWADKEFKTKVGDKEITIKTGDNYAKQSIKVKIGNQPEADVTNATTESEGLVTDLYIYVNGRPEPLQYVSDGALIISGSHTCAWVFSGGRYHQYCW